MFMKSDEVIGSDSRGHKLLSADPSNLVVVPLGFVWRYVYSDFFLSSVCR